MSTSTTRFRKRCLPLIRCCKFFQGPWSQFSFWTLNKCKSFLLTFPRHWSRIWYFFSMEYTHNLGMLTNFQNFLSKTKILKNETILIFLKNGEKFNAFFSFFFLKFCHRFIFFKFFKFSYWNGLMVSYTFMWDFIY